jgi:hypothetical protein
MKPARTVDELEQVAARLRCAAGINAVRAFDIVDIIERKLPTVFPGLKLIRVVDEQLPHAEAEANSCTNTILVRESIYQRAKDWNPRARMILTEEVCHIALGHTGPRYRRHENNKNIFSKTEKRDEHEARQLAALLLAPTAFAKACTSPEQIAEQFCLSNEAASYRWEELEAFRRMESGRRRELPPNVIDFLRAQKRKGFNVTALDDNEK